mgnify:CR=1 FL=1
MRNQKKYDREFKLNVVNLYQEKNKTLSERSKDLGVAPSTLSGWAREYSKEGNNSFSGSGVVKPCNESFTS